MKEEEFISVIKTVIGDKYIGDDCAYLKDMGLVVSQDNLVEDVHFSMKYTTPYRLGYKSAMVNISDIAASGSSCKYILAALSLPKHIDNIFVKEFYNGLKSASKKYGIEVIGGDLTGAYKIMISITVIGKTEGVNISSRKNAKEGQVIVTSGPHGSSSAGLKLLQKGINPDDTKYKHFIYSHLMPEAQVDFGRIISGNLKENYAMMDSSDGLADALYKIAAAGKKTLILDFSKVLYDKELENLFPDEYKDMVLYGGEDYQLIATVPREFAQKFNLDIIGEVIENTDTPVKVINFDNKTVTIDNLYKCFNHFK